MDVSLGSQFQNDPQVALANMEPDAVANRQNKNPSSAAERARWSDRISRLARYKHDHGKQKAQARHPGLRDMKKHDTRGLARKAYGGFRE